MMKVKRVTKKVMEGKLVNSKSDIKTESEENKESSSIPNTVLESLQKQQCHLN